MKVNHDHFCPTRCEISYSGTSLRHNLKRPRSLTFFIRGDDKTSSVAFRSASFVTTLDELPVKGNGRMTQNNEFRWCLEDRK